MTAPIGLVLGLSLHQLGALVSDSKKAGHIRQGQILLDATESCIKLGFVLSHEHQTVQCAARKTPDHQRVQNGLSLLLCRCLLCLTKGISPCTQHSPQRAALPAE